MNYLGQAFKLEKKDLDLIKSRALAFMYAGYNERPVQVVNFRKKDNGGLALHHPELKSQSLLLKNMYRECQERDLRITGGGLSGKVYGFENLFMEVWGKCEKMSSKEIYKVLLRKLVRDKTSLIPSRIERRMQGIRWSKSFRNINKLNVMPIIREFAFLLIQDTLPVNGRLHRKNADKRCLRDLCTGNKCVEIQDRKHFFITCPSVCISFKCLKDILVKFLGKNVNDLQILHLSFTVQDRKVTKVAVWFAVCFLFIMFSKKATDKRSIISEVLNDFNFRINLGLMSGKEVECMRKAISDHLM